MLALLCAALLPLLGAAAPVLERARLADPTAAQLELSLSASERREVFGLPGIAPHLRPPQLDFHVHVVFLGFDAPGELAISVRVHARAAAAHRPAHSAPCRRRTCGSTCARCT